MKIFFERKIDVIYTITLLKKLHHVKSTADTKKGHKSIKQYNI